MNSHVQVLPKKKQKVSGFSQSTCNNMIRNEPSMVNYAVIVVTQDITRSALRRLTAAGSTSLAP